MFDRLSIENPKRENGEQSGRANWFPYYAGFSANFAGSLLKSLQPTSDTLLIDPWNGSGTTTEAAARLGLYAKGYDLNPVMILAAKARLLSVREKPSLWPLAVQIVETAKENIVSVDNDPLATWFIPSSASHIRSIECSVQLHLVDDQDCKFLTTRANYSGISDLAAFYYVALFRANRKLLSKFFTSNPTWTKRPKKKQSRLRSRLETVVEAFLSEVEMMISTMPDERFYCDERGEHVDISVATSESLPNEDESVGFVLGSPPYCTRIDYAVATMSELAILGYRPDDTFDSLRRDLIGTSTVPSSVPEPQTMWGETCLSLLDDVMHHPSKASRTYYYKNHVQYFDSMFRSLAELSRVLRVGGVCVLVAQDSFYKDIYNDLAGMFIEMGSNLGLQLRRREDFQQSRTMAGINPSARAYRGKFDAIESVLCFEKIN